MLRCIFPLCLLFLAVGRCYSFVKPIPSVARLASTISANTIKKPSSRSSGGGGDGTSGIYQYTGNVASIRSSGLPHGIVSFIEKTSKQHSKSAKNTKKSGTSKNKKRFSANTGTDEQDLHELEKEVGRKYGSKNFVPSKVVRQPEPELRPAPHQRAWASALADKVQKRDGTHSVSSEPKFRSLFSGRPSKAPTQQPERPQQSQRAGFRLRPPPPIPPEVAQRALEKEARQKLREEQQGAKRVELREKNKKLFVPFSMHDPSTATIAADSALLANSSFTDVGITQAKVLANLFKMGLTMPTHIQAAAVPAMLRGESVVMHANTGSGKTVAYLLPLTGVINPTSREVQCVIVAPSRELALQIGAVAGEVFAGTPWRVQTLIGGVNIQGQVQRLRDHRPHILVATPGRLGEFVFHLEKLRLNNVRVVVVDEVDNMLQEPYVGDLEALVQATPLFANKAVTRTEQAGSINADTVDGDNQHPTPPAAATALWMASATSSAASVTAFADKYAGADNWRTIAAQSEGGAVPASITHGLISAPKERAMGMLKRFLKAKPAVHSALIFVNDPKRVMGVCKELEIAGIVAAPLHGDTSKDDRKEILMRIKDGRLKYVVTTELAARGLDIPDLSHVINFELPTDAQHYVHRTGRCGRAGRQGLVMNFANPDTKFVVRRFGKQLGVRVRDCEIRDGRVFLKGE